MIYTDNTYKEFIQTYNNFHFSNLKKLNELNKSQVKLLLKQYPYLKDLKGYCFIHQLFTYPQFEKFNTEEFKHSFYTKLVKKIRGLFKHGQAGKTEIACDKIIIDLKKKYITIAITKNTLLANNQWTSRFINFMIKAGLKNLKDEILVISSKYNDLNGNATHCKNLDKAWSLICEKENNFKVIFLCSNKVRIDNICKLLSKYNQPTFTSDLRKKIVIQFDEAHNDMYGIPVCRNYIENMLLYDFVEEFIPITASNKPIYDNDNPLWLKKNIKLNKLNYTNSVLTKSRIKSNSKEYSSIQDAIHMVIEEMYDCEKKDNIINPILFRKHYPNKDYSKLGYTNSCPVALCGDEELALNTAKIILDNQEFEIEITNDDNENDREIINEKIFKKDEINIHIMIAPCRTIITELMMDYARDSDSRPVVIGLYKSQIHYKYLDSENKKKFGIIPGNESKEFNEILYEWIKTKELTNRCIIIIGNYQSVGESNTFVNSDYGYLRSAILLPGCNLNAEKHYQFLLRLCFLLEKFTGLTKHNVTKFIIGYKQGIDDAIEYEKLNDEIVQDLIDNPEESEILLEYTSRTENSSEPINKSISQTIPVQYIIVDEYCEYVIGLRRIMGKENNKRTLEEKETFMDNLVKAIDEKSIIVHDKNSPNIKLEDFTLKEFRCYKDGNNSDNYRFKGYYDTWFLGQKYNNGDLKLGECGIHCCLKKHKTTNGGHINNPNTFYLSFVI